MKNKSIPQIPDYTHIKPRCASERIDWLRLCRTENIGSIAFFHLLERYGSAKAALMALPEIASKGGSPAYKSTYTQKEAEAEFEAHEKMGAQLIFFCDEDYPELLRHIPDPPPVLSAIGRTELLQRPMISIIGARNASIYGKQFARSIASALGKNGYCIVSGFARGIDTAVHESALPTGTIAVLASGVDILYPKENVDLFEHMKTTGLVLSESPLSTPPHATLFPKRNRLVAGMGAATVVIEAAVKSGSLITARFALEYNRDIFVCPGSPLDPRYHGSNQLIRSGATLLQSADDILDALRLQKKSSLHESSPAYSFENITRKSLITPEEARTVIMNNLSFEPISIDELIQECHFSSSDVLTYLLELEVAGKIIRLSPQQVALKEEPL